MSVTVPDIFFPSTSPVRKTFEYLALVLRAHYAIYRYMFKVGHFVGTLYTPRFAYLWGLEGRRVLPKIANTFLQMNDAKGSLDIPVEICVWLNDENVQTDLLPL